MKSGPTALSECIYYNGIIVGLHLSLLLNFSRPRIEIHRVAYKL